MDNLLRSFGVCIALCSIVLSVTSCVSIRAFPVSAQAGDTVTFAIGSLDNVKKSNTTLRYYSDSDPDNPIDLTPNIRSIIRLYPDKTSASYWEKPGGVNGIDIIDTAINVSSHGPWQSVAIVDLPTTLPAGPGRIRFNLGDDVVYPASITKVDNVNIALNILAHDDGSAMVGEEHDFEFRKFDFSAATSVGDLNRLEAMKQVVVKFDPGSHVPSPISAAEYVLNFSVLDQFGNDITASLTSDDFAVVLDDMPDNIAGQVGLNWNKTNSTFSVYLTSPAKQIGAHYVRFSILISNLQEAQLNGWSIADDSAVLQTVKYYDFDGTEIVGPTPLVAVLYN